MAATAGAGGFLVGDTASAIADAGKTGGVQMRTGTVVAWDTSLITVRVGGTPLPGMPYARSYRPILGDIVTVLGSGSTWFCVGAAAGSPPDNAVFNPSFEIGSVGSMPAGWGTFHSAGSLPLTISAQPWIGPGPLDGPQVLDFTTSTPGGANQTTFDYTYSQAFAVTPGDTWAVACYAITQTLAAPNDTASVGVFLSYYANSTNVYPNTSAADSSGDFSYVGDSSGWQLINGGNPSGITIPSGAAYARLTLYTIITTSASFGGPILDIDGVIARKVS